jgi:hypothetical protein
MIGILPFRCDHSVIRRLSARHSFRSVNGERTLGVAVRWSTIAVAPQNTFCFSPTTTEEVGVLKQQTSDGEGAVKVTFVLPLAEFEQPVSVLGGFNGWDPFMHPLKRRSNGTRSVTVTVPAGSAYEFKYLAAGGEWFCDPEVEAVGVSDLDALNSLLRT